MDIRLLKPVYHPFFAANDMTNSWIFKKYMLVMNTK